MGGYLPAQLDAGLTDETVLLGCAIQKGQSSIHGPTVDNSNTAMLGILNMDSMNHR